MIEARARATAVFSSRRSRFRASIGGLPITARELPRLPQLPFVFAEILHDERPHVGNAEQPLAGGVDGEAAEVAGDPAAIQLSAMAAVVPLPAKRSRTRSPSLEEAAAIR